MPGELYSPFPRAREASPGGARPGGDYKSPVIARAGLQIQPERREHQLVDAILEIIGGTHVGVPLVGAPLGRHKACPYNRHYRKLPGLSF
jgi:hypothetical protein